MDTATSEQHSPFLRAYKEQNGKGHELLTIESDKETKKERFTSMKEKQRPLITSGLESIEEEFKNLQTKDVISRFTNELDSKEGQDKFLAHL